jgi:hypothetical protein
MGVGSQVTTPVRSTPRVLALLVPAALLLAACDAPVVGDWRSDNQLTDGSRNTMSVDGDLAGTAKFHATPANDTGAWVRFEFDFTGKEADDGMSWRFSMSCSSGPCNGDDFKMNCQVIDEGSNSPVKMKCTGNARWTGYPFDWEQVN